MAYLHPAAERGNVEVLTDTLATRILLENGRAAGVEILRNNELETVRAEREVIVCAGAYHSPHLLLLSGIGPADELRALGIEPKLDLPVGKNLHDHPFVGIVWLTEQESLRTAMTPENLALFEREGRGPLTSGFSEGGAFIRTRPGLVAPDIQFHFGGGAAPREAADPPIPHDGFTIFPTLLSPTSRGQVTLRNRLAHAKPRILHNYYATEDDRRSVIDGTRVALEIASRPALRKLHKADWAVPESDSDADILAFVRRNTRTIFHPVGTCAMGTVVDAELRVHGVERLRVVDASVMPTVPRGNTNAPTIMIAEKAADLIRGLPPLPRRPRPRLKPSLSPGRNADTEVNSKPHMRGEIPARATAGMLLGSSRLRATATPGLRRREQSLAAHLMGGSLASCTKGAVRRGSRIISRLRYRNEACCCDAGCRRRPAPRRRSRPAAS